MARFINSQLQHFLASTTLTAAALFALSLPAVVLHAQVGTSDVLGTITDVTGASIPNATVTLLDEATGETRTAQTDARGAYTFATVSLGHYSVKVDAPGFKPVNITDIQVLAGERQREDASLAPGGRGEVVEVSAQTAPTLQTDSTNLGSTVSEKQVQDLPLSGRNITQAIQVQPGVTAGLGGGGNGQVGAVSGGTTAFDRRPTNTVSANGQSDELNNQMIDGFDNNERQSGLIGLKPSLDGIAEVQVDTSTYSAQYGRTAGAVINVLTKSGTNKFHGSAYEYLRNDIFDSRDFFSTVGSKPELRLNEFGGSLGGPIFKNKTFFFADYEQDRTVRGQSQVITVPTAFEQSNPGNFSDVIINGAPGPVLPASALSPIALAYFALYPLPNVPGAGAANNFQASPRFVQNITTFDIRIDHRFSANDLFFARYANNPVTTVVPSPLPEKDGIFPNGSGLGSPGNASTKSQNMQFDYLHIFNTHLLLDLKAAYTRINIADTAQNYGKGAAAKVGIPNAYIPGLPDTDVLPEVGGPADPWAALGDALDTPLFDINNTFQYAASIALTKGQHSIKIGGGVIRRQSSLFQDAYAGGFFVFVGAPPYFDPRVNFITGNAIVELRQNSISHPGFRVWEPSAYIQDDWRATSRLTLNLGLRYDVFTPFTEAHNQYTNFNPATLQFIQGTDSSTIGVKTDYHNVAPRIGFAYSIDPKTVIRGAFGMSYFPLDIGVASAGSAQGPVSVIQNYNPPYSFNYFAAGPSVNFANGPVRPAPVDLTTYASNPNVTSLSYKPFNLHSSYVEQYNLALQHQFGANTVTLAGVGVLGKDLQRAINLDLPNPSGANQATLPYLYPQLPFVNTIAQVYNGAASNYAALQIVFDRQIAKGASFAANYTLAHGLADGGNTDPSDPSVDYGNSSLDVRHRFAMTATYKLPFGDHSHGFIKSLIGDYQLNGLGFWQTSTPFTIENDVVNPANGLAFINQPGVTVDRPNVIAKVSGASQTAPGYAFNIKAFTPQTPGTVGDERVNQYYGPHDRRVDLSLLKDFTLEREVKLQFRAECFNISNTPNFAQPTNSITSFDTDASGKYTTPSSGTAFGTLTGTLGSETPRQFQFALKILF